MLRAVLQCTACLFFFQAEDGIRDLTVTGVQTCALPIWFYVPSRKRARVVLKFSVLRASVEREPGCRKLPFTRKNCLADSGTLWPSTASKIGRASCRERGKISVVPVSLKKKKKM